MEKNVKYAVVVGSVAAICGILSLTMLPYDPLDINLARALCAAGIFESMDSLLGSGLMQAEECAEIQNTYVAKSLLGDVARVLGGGAVGLAAGPVIIRYVKKMGLKATTE